MTIRRAGLAAVVVKDRLYAIGGTPSDRKVTSAEVLNLTKVSAWEPLPPMESPRNNLAAAEFEGKLFAVGGYDGSQSLDTLVIFDPSMGTWAPQPSMGNRRKNL